MISLEKAFVSQSVEGPPGAILADIVQYSDDAFVRGRQPKHHAQGGECMELPLCHVQNVACTVSNESETTLTKPALPQAITIQPPDYRQQCRHGEPQSCRSGLGIGSHVGADTRVAFRLKLCILLSIWL